MVSSMKHRKKNANVDNSIKLRKIKGLEHVDKADLGHQTSNLETNSQEASNKGKRKRSQVQPESKEKNIKLCEEDRSIKGKRITDLNNQNSDECEENITCKIESEDKTQISKKSKKKRKKKVSKSIGNGNELNLACLTYLSSWKNDKESWKFEKLKQIRLISNMFDKEKLPNEHFSIFLEYMDKASENMRKLVVTRASEIVFNVEKWNDLNDQEKLSSPKPKDYEGYERARELLQSFE